MFLRDVLKRTSTRRRAAADPDCLAELCRATPSLLAELATDPADFADLAHVLGLDLCAVVEALMSNRGASQRWSHHELHVTSARASTRPRETTEHEKRRLPPDDRTLANSSGEV